MSANQNIFEKIFKQKLWGQNCESVSGPGSSLDATKNLRENLPFFFQKYHIKSILDIPCGDFNYMKEIDLSGISYLGADIVKELIGQNQLKYPKVNFQVMDLLQDELPLVDMIICRDCLFHMPFDLIKKALVNFKKSGSKYILTTSHTWKNFQPKDIQLGDFRKLNLQMPPINLPAPLDFIVEGNQEYMQADRCMLLYECKDL